MIDLTELQELHQQLLDKKAKLLESKLITVRRRKTMDKQIKMHESEAEALKRAMLAELQRMEDIDNQLEQVNRGLDNIQERARKIGWQL